MGRLALPIGSWSTVLEVGLLGYVRRSLKGNTVEGEVRTTD